MTRNWLDILRNRQNDRQNALRKVQQSSERARRESLSEYDAFVAPALAIKDGLLIGTAKSSAGEEVPIRLPWVQEYVMGLIQGGTGTGKTSLIDSILRQELIAGRPIGLIDGKADLFNAAIRSTAVIGHCLDADRRKKLLERLIVVNPFSNHLVPLNVCRPFPGCSAETQAYEVALVLSRLFDTGMGLHMENILRHLLLLLIESGLSLVEAPLILQNELLRGMLVKRSGNVAVKDFFLRNYESIAQVSKDALLNRLQGLLLPENVRLMFGADDLLDLRAVLDRGDPMYVFLGKGPNVPEELMEILGSLLMQLIFQATYARGSGSRSKYLLVMDEFFHLLAAPGLTKRFETALTTARSFGLSLLLINHNFAQLSPALREVILGNVDIVGLFRTSARNAELFGDFLPEVSPESLRRGSQGKVASTRHDRLEALQRLPNRELYFYDRRKPYRALSVEVPNILPPHLTAGITEDKLERMIREEGWDRGRAALPREQLRTQIEARRRKLDELLHPPVRPSAPGSKDSLPRLSTNPKKPKLG